MILKKKKYPPFYTKLPDYYTYVVRQEKQRNQPEVRKNLIAEYGELRSFLADKYPECRQTKRPKREQPAEDEEE